MVNQTKIGMGHSFPNQSKVGMCLLALPSSAGQAAMVHPLFLGVTAALCCRHSDRMALNRLQCQGSRLAATTFLYSRSSFCVLFSDGSLRKRS